MNLHEMSSVKAVAIGAWTQVMFTLEVQPGVYMCIYIYPKIIYRLHGYTILSYPIMNIYSILSMMGPLLQKGNPYLDVPGS